VGGRERAKGSETHKKDPKKFYIKESDDVKSTQRA
jgi:hypothetical protein